MFFEQYWGGPTTYSEQRGHPRLRMRHGPFRVTPDMRDRWLLHMMSAVDTLELDPELDDRLRDYLTRAAYSLVNTPGPDGAYVTPRAKGTHRESQVIHGAAGSVRVLAEGQEPRDVAAETSRKGTRRDNDQQEGRRHRRRGRCRAGDRIRHLIRGPGRRRHTRAVAHDAERTNGSNGNGEEWQRSGAGVRAGKRGMGGMGAFGVDLSELASKLGVDEAQLRDAMAAVRDDLKDEQGACEASQGRPERGPPGPPRPDAAELADALAAELGSTRARSAAPSRSSKPPARPSATRP